MPLREERVHSVRLHPVGKALIEPELLPPLHGYQVPEPHVRQLVRDHCGLSPNQDFVLLLRTLTEYSTENAKRRKGLRAVMAL